MAYSTAIDRKWQEKWEELGLYRFDPDAPGEKLYCLEMFSYPSGAKLHVGHWYNYALTDIWARMKKMQGYNVFQPMGFDAFGLPAENYAIKTGIHPETSTLQNIEAMEAQLHALGGMFAWDHELATCLPDYYKWTQWLFLKLYEKGLAYRKNAPVNWCPSCQTVLANEQVKDGHCDRCGTEVTRKNLTQWFFKITDYSQELLDGLEGLDWPDKTKKIQNHWIGRSEGGRIRFALRKDNAPLRNEDGEEEFLEVFTTRADTLFGVSYVVVAPESEQAQRLLTDAQRAQAEAYIEQTRKVSEIERQATDRPKTGVFTGSYAVHPFTGEPVEVWLGDYVIASYGTGAVMAVPAHDTRDFAFAQKYNLPIRRVITDPAGSSELPFTEEGILVDSDRFNGLSSAEARKAILQTLAEQNLGGATVNYRLRDWLVSRQRYWGAPIPIVHCPCCGAVPVPEDQLPVTLPKDVEFRPDGKSPLENCVSFMETTCPRCGKPARRDPDTLDTFVCSSWYYLRYADNQNPDQAFDPKIIDRLLPVDQYVGGAEHAAMHLLYARFITKALRDMGYLHFDEPFLSLVHQGTILGSDGFKMSKSRGNTVIPDEYVSRYGADVFRLYLAFAFAFTEGGPWNDDGIRSIAKFVSRIERLTEDIQAVLQEQNIDWTTVSSPDASSLHGADRELNYVLHHSLKGVQTDAAKFQFNTSLSRLMELCNALNRYLAEEKHPNASLLGWVHSRLLLALAPFAPHLTEELWEQTGHASSVFFETWPEVDPEALKKDSVEIAVQINGQVRHRIEIPTQATASEVEAMVLADPTVCTQLSGRTVRKAIYIPGRLVNLVVAK